MNKKIINDIIHRTEGMFPQLVLCHHCYGYKGFKLDGLIIHNSKLAYLIALKCSSISNMRQECNCKN